MVELGLLQKFHENKIRRIYYSFEKVLPTPNICSVARKECSRNASTGVNKNYFLAQL